MKVIALALLLTTFAFAATFTTFSTRAQAATFTASITFDQTRFTLEASHVYRAQSTANPFCVDSFLGGNARGKEKSQPLSIEASATGVAISGEVTNPFSPICNYDYTNTVIEISARGAVNCYQSSAPGCVLPAYISLDALRDSGTSMSLNCSLIKESQGSSVVCRKN